MEDRDEHPESDSGPDDYQQSVDVVQELGGEEPLESLFSNVIRDNDSPSEEEPSFSKEGRIEEEIETDEPLNSSEMEESGQVGMQKGIGQVGVPRRRKKGVGSFNTIGLTDAIERAVRRKGYKLLTPIQRKVIPLLLGGANVVASSRTGSGKTAAFLLPILAKLGSHVDSFGIRALVISPTRELSLQTAFFARDFTRFTDLRTCVIVGGEAMDLQFSSLHQNPDLIIATPGRLLHIVDEMRISLTSVQYLVLDEADRLFEQGFHDQLVEILEKMNSQKVQKMLLSATMPSVLQRFGTKYFTNSIQVRLDSESRLSPDLKMNFFVVNKEDKLAFLVYILREIVFSEKKSNNVMIFVASRHHVEYLHMILSKIGMNSAYLYGTLDQSARKMNIAQFRAGKMKIMIVTDIAARGIDIPSLDNVIEFNIPASPKIHVHRLGRVARAGRAGTAYSFFCRNELGYYLDFITEVSIGGDHTIGLVPTERLDSINEEITAIQSRSLDVQGLRKTIENAEKMVEGTRKSASKKSVLRAKELQMGIKVHKLFQVSEKDEIAEKKEDMLSRLRDVRMRQNIFDFLDGSVGKKDIKGRGVLSSKVSSEKSSIVELVDSDRFKDEKFFIDSNRKSEDPSLLDMKEDEVDRLKKRKVWDKKKRKFVDIESVGSSKRKNEAGKTITDSKADGGK